MDPNTAEQTTLSLLDFFKMGGWAMWPLLIFSILTISLIIERFIAIFIANNISIKRMHIEVIDLLNNNSINSAIDYLKKCNKKQIGAHILLSGLNMANLGEHRMEKAIETEALDKGPYPQGARL